MNFIGAANMPVDVPTKVSAQILEALDRYKKPLRDARSRNATEGDTSLLVHSILADVFGYDRFNEITSEFKIKGQFADYVVKAADRLLMVVEVKAIGLKLNEQHLFQAAGYAAREGVEWVLLTNGAQWDLYRVEFTQPVNVFKVYALDFLDGNPSLEVIAPIHRWGMQKGLALAEWQRQTALSAANIVKALLSEEVMKGICSHVRKATGLRVDHEEMQNRLIEDVIRPGLVGQVSVSDVKAKVESGSGTRRVRLKSLITGGFLPAGDQIIAEWEGSAYVALVEPSGVLRMKDSEFSSLDDITRAVTGNAVRTGWDFWSRSNGESLVSVRERFIEANP